MRRRICKHFCQTVCAAVALMLWTTACTTEDYESGNGEYSYLRADFAEVHTVGSKKVANARTDEGDSLVLQPPLDCSWTTTPDSTYRALLYYSREPGKKLEVKGFSAMQVLVLNTKVPKEGTEVRTDPLTLESAWLSPNGKYLNLGLYVKIGKGDAKDAYQTLGMVRDTVITTDDGTKVHHLRLMHNQNGMPEYYSSRIYTSTPLAPFGKGDVLRVEVNTYEGKVVRMFTL